MYLGKKYQKIFPAGPLFHVLQIKFLLKCPYFKKFIHLTWKIPGSTADNYVVCYWSLFKMLLILLRNSAFFPVKIFFVFTWFFGIILLSKQFFWKNNFWFGCSILKNFCWTYVWPDLNHIWHLDRLVKNIYFKAWLYSTSLKF